MHAIDEVLREPDVHEVHSAPFPGLIRRRRLAAVARSAT